MRGSDAMTGSMFTYVDIEARIPASHPIRLVRRIVNEVLAGLDGEFAAMYSDLGRPSISPVSAPVWFCIRSTGHKLLQRACAVGRMRNPRRRSVRV